MKLTEISIEFSVLICTYVGSEGAYNLNEALGGLPGFGVEEGQLPDLVLGVGGLMQPFDADLYDKYLRIIEKKRNKSLSAEEIGNERLRLFDMGKVLKWAFENTSFRHVHADWMNEEVLFLDTLDEYINNYPDKTRDMYARFNNCESLHLGKLNISVPQNFHLEIMARSGHLNNLKSLMFSLGVVSTFRELFHALALNCQLEEIGDMREWNFLAVHTFTRVGTITPWKTLKRLQVGPIISAAAKALHFDHGGHQEIAFSMEATTKWERNMERCQEAYDGDGILDESFFSDAMQEVRNLSVVSQLSQKAFPSLEELTFTFETADEVSFFFFAWMAFTFYHKVAMLEHECGRRTTAKTEFFPVAAGTGAESDTDAMCSLPVSAGIRKINIICSKLSDLDYEADTDQFGMPRYHDNSDRWNNQFSWLKAKYKRFPGVFPICLFPDLQELSSNCGLPHHKFLQFLKGEPNPRLERLDIFIGLHASTTMTFLLNNLMIDVAAFSIRPDMALPGGYLRHVMERLDLSDERQCKMYRLLRTHCIALSMPFWESSDTAYLRDVFLGTGLLLHRGIEVVDPKVFQMSHRPMLYTPPCMEGTEGKEELLSASPFLELPGTTQRELRSGLRCRADAAWLTAVKNNCFATSTELHVPEWLLAVLCCYCTRDNMEGDDPYFSYVPCDRKDEQGRSAGMERMHIERKTAQVFCHTPRLQELHITMDFDIADELTEERKNFLCHSMGALVEAACGLRQKADTDPAYQTRDKKAVEPWLPVNVYHSKTSDDDIHDEHGELSLPVAFGELRLLVFTVPGGNPSCYSVLREALLSCQLEGISGTTLASRLPLLPGGTAFRPESVPESFQGHYRQPEAGAVPSVIQVQVRHEERQSTTVFCWKDV